MGKRSLIVSCLKEQKVDIGQSMPTVMQGVQPGAALPLDETVTCATMTGGTGTEIATAVVILTKTAGLTIVTRTGCLIETLIATWTEWQTGTGYQRETACWIVIATGLLTGIATKTGSQTGYQREIGHPFGTADRETATVTEKETGTCGAQLSPLTGTTEDQGRTTMATAPHPL